MMDLYLGTDPGFSGAIAAVSKDRGKLELVHVVSLDGTPQKIAHQLSEIASTNRVVGCYLEHVHAFPKQGVSSTFKFGVSYGMCIGILAALRIPYMLVSPLRWQRALGLKTRGDKRVAAEAAAALVGADVPIKQADAVLIAVYCARHWSEA